MKIPAVSLELDVSITFQTHQESLERWNKKDLPRKRREDKATHKQTNKRPPQKPQTQNKNPRRKAVCLCSLMSEAALHPEPIYLCEGTHHKRAAQELVHCGRWKKPQRAGNQAESQRQAPAAAYIPNIKDTIYI